MPATKYSPERLAASRRTYAIRSAARRQGRPWPTQWVDAAPAREHLRALLADPDWGSITNIAAASQISCRTIIERIMQGQPTIHRATHDTLIAADTDALRRHAPRVPVRLAAQRVGSMQAQGWPLAWQAAQIYRAKSTLANALARHEQITRPVFEAIDALYERVGDRTGPSAGSVAAARRAGWLPGRFYCEDSHLRPDWIPDAELAELQGGGAGWAADELAARASRRRLQDRLDRRHDKAAQRIEAIEMSLAGDGLDIIAERLGCHDVIVQRYRTEAGLRFAYDCDARRSVPREESRERADRARQILAEHHAADGADPFTTVRRLGMMTGRTWDFDAPAAPAAQMSQAS